MRRIIFPLVIVAVCVALVVLYISTDLLRMYRTEGPIVAFGDSLTDGFGAVEGNDFATALQNRVGVPIINEGKRDITTEDALVLVDEVVLPHNPRIVIVFLGVNDMIQEKPADETFKNLSAAIDRIHAHRARVLLIGFAEGPAASVYSARFAQLAEQKHAAYVPDIFEGIKEKKELMFDDVHPNDAGYEKMAERVESSLRELL